MCRARQPALLELARHGDEALYQRGGVLPRERPPPRVRAASTVAEDPARHREARLVGRRELGDGVEGLLREQAGGEIELGLDVRLGAGGPDVGHVAPRAEQQSDGVREDGLARPRLSRDDVESGRELDLRLLDQNEVLDAQAAQHRSQRCSRNTSR